MKNATIHQFKEYKKCKECNIPIERYNAIYMCVDHSFCSISCRDKQFKYIRKLDPDLNYPHTWYDNNDRSSKINCLIEIDYFKIQNKSQKLTRSQSLYTFTEINKNDVNNHNNTNNNNNTNNQSNQNNKNIYNPNKIFITCIKLNLFNIFNFIISNKIVKPFILFFVIFLIIFMIKFKY